MKSLFSLSAYESWEFCWISRPMLKSLRKKIPTVYWQNLWTRSSKDERLNGKVTYLLMIRVQAEENGDVCCWDYHSSLILDDWRQLYETFSWVVSQLSTRLLFFSASNYSYMDLNLYYDDPALQTIHFKEILKPANSASPSGISSQQDSYYFEFTIWQFHDWMHQNSQKIQMFFCLKNQSFLAKATSIFIP